jgi:fatty-acyl-CoA synthase
MERMGFNITHAYGLTETYGPSTLCAWQTDWDALEPNAKAAKMARQGVAMPTQHEVAVIDPVTLLPVPADGTTIGEIAVRGNTVMKGYLKNEKGTEAAFAGGWFRSGDLAVQHADGYIEIKDRLKDIIISGGENISSLEVEEVLYRHPKVMEAAVVAKHDDKWGETPCAFVTLKVGAGAASQAEIIAWCRTHLAAFKCPRHVVFTDLPKTPTGKIQKFQLRVLADDV